MGDSLGDNMDTKKGRIRSKEQMEKDIVKCMLCGKRYDIVAGHKCRK